MSGREIHENDDLLVGLVHDGLDADERRDVEAHLAACAECRASVDELRRVGDALRALPPPASGAAGEAKLDQAKARTYAAVIAAMERRAQPSSKPKGRSFRQFLVLAVSMAAAVLVTTTIFFKANESADEARNMAAAPATESPRALEAKRLDFDAKAKLAKSEEKAIETASRPPAAAPWSPSPPPAEPTTVGARLDPSKRAARDEHLEFQRLQNDEAEVDRCIAAYAVNNAGDGTKPANDKEPAAGPKRPADGKARLEDRVREKEEQKKDEGRKNELEHAERDAFAGATRAWVVRASTEPARVLVLRNDGSFSWGPLPTTFATRWNVPSGPGVGVISPLAIDPEIARVASATTEPGDYAALRSVLLLELTRKARDADNDVALRARLDALSREALSTREKLARLELERHAVGAEADAAKKVQAEPAPMPAAK